ncbi:MAG: hypothetical protein R3Y24_11355 [Eubacteriales bacterium]
MINRQIEFYKKNRFFAILIFVEAIVLLWCLLWLFEERQMIEVDINSMWIENQPQIEIQDEGLVFTDVTVDMGGLQLCSSTFTIKPGAYQITINYQCEETSYEMEDIVAVSYLNSDQNNKVLSGEQIQLQVSREQAQAKAWISGWDDISDMRIYFYHTGTSDMILENIVLEEVVVWRYIVLVTVLLGAVGIDLLYMLFLSNKPELVFEERKKYSHILILVSIAFVGSLPLFADFVFEGHDIKFHMMRIVSVASELQNGQFPVRMMTNMLNGYGYPTSLYYCDIFLYFPAILYNCMVPIYMCYQIYIIVINIFTVFIAYYCFNKIVKNRSIALLGSAMYTLSIYRLVNVYLRAAVGEMTAMTFLPLVILGVWNIYHVEKPKYRDGILLSIGMAGIIQSHMLTLEMTLLFIGMIAIVYIRKTIQIQRMKVLLLQVVTTIGITAWYFIPFLHGVFTTNIKGTGSEVSEIQSLGLYLVQIFAVFMTGDGTSIVGLTDEMPLNIGIGIIVGSVFVLYCSWKREDWKLEKQQDWELMRITFILGVLALFMTTIYFPWDSLKDLFGKKIAYILTLVQFPWRYLAIATPLLTLAILLAMKLLKMNKAKIYECAIFGIVIGMFVSVGCFYFEYTSNVLTMDDVEMQVARTLKIGSGEYLLEGSDKTLVTNTEILSDSESLVVVEYIQEEGITYIDLKNIGDENISITLPIFNYDNYQIIDIDTGKIFLPQNGENNRMELEIEGNYGGIIEIKYIVPVLYRISECITLITLICLMFVFFKDKKLKVKSLSDN